jgi:tRNA(Ile)-lysidine synthase
LYYGSVHELARKVLGYVRQRELLQAGERVGVAVSGGTDSVALLRLLLELRRELGIVLSVVHYDHKLRGAESDADAQFVGRLAHEHKLPLHLGSGEVARHASETHLSVETAARELRYAFFAELMDRSSTEEDLPKYARLPGRERSSRRDPKTPLDKIATGHTLDDQAETVLMRVIRGTGMTGLGGIQPRLELKSGEIVRPLLAIRRAELEPYLAEIHQSWQDDSSNRETKHTRNRVRHRLLPLLEGEFNPTVTARLSELAEIARAEEDYWDNEAAGWFGTVVHWFPAGQRNRSGLVQIGSSPPAPPEEPAMNAMLDLGWLVHEPFAVQRRVIRAIGKAAGVPLDFAHVHEILRFSQQEGGRNTLGLPWGWKVTREPGTLTFLAPSSTPESPGAYEYAMPLPGRAMVPELGTVLEAVRLMPGCEATGYNPEHLFDPALLSKELVVRNWRPGDRFWPAHTKSPRKIKELLQERHLGQPDRTLWPVVVSGEEIVWVRGFPGRAHLRPSQETGSILIREVPMADEGRDPR